MKSLEVAVVKTLSCLSVEAFTTGATGVWVSHPLKGDCKICAIGWLKVHCGCHVDVMWVSCGCHVGVMWMSCG